MESEELPPEAPGQLVPYGRRPYYKPEPLPPSGELALDEEVTGKERYQEFRAAEIFEILERPPETY